MGSDGDAHLEHNFVVDIACTAFAMDGWVADLDLEVVLGKAIAVVGRLRPIRQARAAAPGARATGRRGLFRCGHGLGRYLCGGRLRQRTRAPPPPSSHSAPARQRVFCAVSERVQGARAAVRRAHERVAAGLYWSVNTELETSRAQQRQQALLTPECTGKKKNFLAFHGAGQS